jgi:hypothetical protein
MSTKMLATNINRLRCTQCSKTYKEVKLLNRHRREKHSQETRWPCDYPGCSIDFQCLRFKSEHVKKQHTDQMAHSLSPDEQFGLGFQADIPGSRVHMPYEYLYADVTPQVPTTPVPETPRLPLVPIVDESPSTPKSVSACESPPRLSDGLEDLWAKTETVAQTQAIITSIWSRDVDALSNIIDESDLDSEFGEAATFELVQKLQGITSESIFSPASPRWKLLVMLTGRSSIIDFTRYLWDLTPVRLAVLTGHLESVIYLVSRTRQSQQDLLQWQGNIETRFGRISRDKDIAAFLSYHNRGTHSDSPESHGSFSSDLLNSVRDELAICCPKSTKDMPGGMKWLEHAIRRGNATGAYVLLERGADQHATLVDGTPLMDLALENGQDEIAELLFQAIATIDPRFWAPRTAAERRSCGA